MAELRICRMGEFAARDEFVAEGTFGAEGDMIFGGFTVDEKSRTAGGSRGGESANTAALFTDDEEKREIARAAGEKRFRGRDHGSDDSLGVTGAAAVDVGIVFARGEERRNRVHVRGEGDVGVAEREEEVVATWLCWLAIEAGVVFRREWGKMGEEIVGQGFFVACGGVNVHQRAG